MNNKLIEELGEKFYQFREKYFDKIPDEDWDLLEKSWFLNLLEEKYFNQSYNNIVLYKRHIKDKFEFVVLNHNEILNLNDGYVYTYSTESNINNYFFITENQKQLVKNYIDFKEWLLNEKVEGLVLDREILKFIQNTTDGYLTNAIEYLNYTQQDKKLFSLINEYKKHPDILNIAEIKKNEQNFYEILCLKSGSVTRLWEVEDSNSVKIKNLIEKTKKVIINKPQKIEGFLNFNRKDTLDMLNLKQTKDWVYLCEYAKKILSKEYENVFINKEGIKIELLDVKQIFKDPLNINILNNDKNTKLSLLNDVLKYEDIEKCLIKEILPIDKSINHLDVNEWFGLKYLNNYSISSCCDELDIYLYNKAFILLKTNKNDLIGYLSITQEKDCKNSLSINTISVCEQFRNQGFAKILYQALKELIKDKNFIVKRDFDLISNTGNVSIKNVDFNESVNVIELKRKLKGFRDILNNANYDFRDFLKYGRINDKELQLIIQLQKITAEMDKKSIFLTDKNKKNLLEDFNQTIENFEIKDSPELNLDELLNEVIKYQGKLQIKALLQKENNEKKQKLTI